MKWVLERMPAADQAKLQLHENQISLSKEAAAIAAGAKAAPVSRLPNLRGRNQQQQSIGADAVNDPPNGDKKPANYIYDVSELSKDTRTK